MGYEYGSKKTALNGIYLWLQTTGHIKVTKNTQFSQDKSMRQCGDIMSSFLKTKNPEFKTITHSNFREYEKAAIKIQRIFQEFTKYVIKTFKPL